VALVNGARLNRAVGHQAHIVEKQRYSAAAAMPPKTQVGQIGKVDLGAAVNCET